MPGFAGAGAARNQGRKGTIQSSSPNKLRGGDLVTSRNNGPSPLKKLADRERERAQYSQQQQQQQQQQIQQQLQPQAQQVNQQVTNNMNSEIQNQHLFKLQLRQASNTTGRSSIGVGSVGAISTVASNLQHNQVQPKGRTTVTGLNTNTNTNRPSQMGALSTLSSGIVTKFNTRDSRISNDNTLFQNLDLKSVGPQSSIGLQGSQTSQPITFVQEPMTGVHTGHSTAKSDSDHGHTRRQSRMTRGAMEIMQQQKEAQNLAAVQQAQAAQAQQEQQQLLEMKQRRQIQMEEEKTKIDALQEFEKELSSMIEAVEQKMSERSNKTAASPRSIASFIKNQSAKSNSADSKGTTTVLKSNSNSPTNFNNQAQSVENQNSNSPQNQSQTQNQQGQLQILQTDPSSPPNFRKMRDELLEKYKSIHGLMHVQTTASDQQQAQSPSGPSRNPSPRFGGLNKRSLAAANQFRHASKIVSVGHFMNKIQFANSDTQYEDFIQNKESINSSLISSRQQQNQIQNRNSQGQSQTSVGINNISYSTVTGLQQQLSGRQNDSSNFGSYKRQQLLGLGHGGPGSGGPGENVITDNNMHGSGSFEGPGPSMTENPAATTDMKGRKSTLRYGDATVIHLNDNHSFESSKHELQNLNLLNPNQIPVNSRLTQVNLNQNQMTGTGGPNQRPSLRSIQQQNVAQEDGLTEFEFISWVDKELQDERACLSLPFSFLMFALFAALMVEHLGAAYLRDIYESIDSHISRNANFAYDSTGNIGYKNMNDVYEIGHFWGWLRLGFIPTVFADNYQYSEETNYSDVSGDPVIAKSIDNQALAKKKFISDYNRDYPLINDFLRFNFVATDARLIKRTKSQIKCGYIPKQVMTSWGTNTLGPCYSLKEMWSKYYTRDLTMLMPPEEEPGSDLSDKSRSVEVKWIDITKKSSVEVADNVREWEEDVWIQDDTEKVEVQFININREYGVMSLVTIHFLFFRGGIVTKYLTVESAWLHKYNVFAGQESYLGIFPNYIWFLNYSYVIMNFVILFNEMTDMRVVLLQRGNFWQFLYNYCHIWNVLALIALFFGILLIQQFLSYLDARNLFLIEFEKGPDGWQRETLYAAANQFIYTKTRVRAFAIFNLVLSMSRLFRGFAAQPRLGLVTSTLKMAFSDIFHFLIVFIVVFITFVGSGQLLFGEHIREFETFPNGIMSCWRIVVGDFDFEALSGVNYFGALVFITLFTIIVVLILLNMLLAIILETYLAVKREQTEHAETLYSQAMETLGRYINKKRGRRIGLDEVKRKILLDSKKRYLLQMGLPDTESYSHQFYIWLEDPCKKRQRKSQARDLNNKGQFKYDRGSARSNLQNSLGQVNSQVVPGDPQQLVQQDLVENEQYINVNQNDNNQIQNQMLSDTGPNQALTVTKINTNKTQTGGPFLNVNEDQVIVGQTKSETVKRQTVGTLLDTIAPGTSAGIQSMNFHLNTSSNEYQDHRDNNNIDNNDNNSSESGQESENSSNFNIMKSRAPGANVGNVFQHVKTFAVTRHRQESQTDLNNEKTTDNENINQQESIALIDSQGNNMTGGVISRALNSAVTVSRATGPLGPGRQTGGYDEAAASQNNDNNNMAQQLNLQQQMMQKQKTQITNNRSSTVRGNTILIDHHSNENNQNMNLNADHSILNTDSDSDEEESLRQYYIPEQTIIDFIKDESNKRILTAKGLRKIIPNMRKAQSIRLIRQAIEDTVHIEDEEEQVQEEQQQLDQARFDTLVNMLEQQHLDIQRQVDYTESLRITVDRVIEKLSSQNQNISNHNVMSKVQSELHPDDVLNPIVKDINSDDDQINDVSVNNQSPSDDNHSNSPFSSYAKQFQQNLNSTNSDLRKQSEGILSRKANKWNVKKLSQARSNVTLPGPGPESQSELGSVGPGKSNKSNLQITIPGQATETQKTVTESLDISLTKNVNTVGPPNSTVQQQSPTNHNVDDISSKQSKSSSSSSELDISRNIPGFIGKLKENLNGTKVVTSHSEKSGAAAGQGTVSRDTNTKRTGNNYNNSSTPSSPKNGHKQQQQQVLLAIDHHFEGP